MKKTIDKLDINLIKKTLVKNRNLKLFIGGFLLIASITILVNATQDLPFETAFVVGIICMLVGFTGLYFILHALFRYNAQRNYLIVLVENNPNLVAWIYYVKIQNFPFGVRFIQYTTLYIHLLNREKITLQMPEEDILDLMQLLRSRIPTATYGYSKYKEQLYNISPDLLINDY